jgi:hypothetical protein
MTTSTRLYANNAKTTLASAVQPTDTTIQVANSSIFPQPTTGQYFLVTIDTGSTQEVVQVTSNNVSTNTFSGCVRGFENTTAGAYQAGTRIENRVTAGTLGSFARYQDRMASIASLDALSAPGQSDSNSYVTITTDDGGNPILAYTNGNNGIWAFENYVQTILSGTLTSTGTTSSVTVANSTSQLPTPISGKYIIQFTTGLNKGLVRAITNVSSNVVSWATPLPNVPASADGYQILQSTTSYLTAVNLAANNGLIYAILLSN